VLGCNELIMEYIFQINMLLLNLYIFLNNFVYIYNYVITTFNGHTILI
jgi:hypothetical protein